LLEVDEQTGLGTANLVRAVVQSPAFVSVGEVGRIDDVVITSSHGFHLIQFVPTAFDPRLVLYAWPDPESGNLALAKRSLRLIARDLVAGRACPGPPPRHREVSM
jgi:hypothetical protein